MSIGFRRYHRLDISQHNHEKENSEHKVVTVSITVLPYLLSTRFTAHNVGSHHKCTNVGSVIMHNRLAKRLQALKDKSPIPNQ